ncbi:MAG: putative membrane protein YfcA [Paracoccaceae bacterium]|jgi:uncharacterized membrane protein YfcA
MDMTSLFAEHGVTVLLIAICGMFAGGFAKGAVGFALPMISVSISGSVLPAALAVAGMILPGVITNLWQTFRHGGAAAFGTLREHWRLNAILFVMIGLCAQLVVALPDRALFLILGVGVTAFGLVQVLGWRPAIPRGRQRVAEAVAALVAGFFGGLAGVWGPPIILYFLALEMPKREMVRAQGVSFLLGSLILVAAHLRSGLLLGEGGAFSVLMIAPACIGMALGQSVQDRLNPVLFRKAVLIVLAIAGLNLLRRGLMG